MAVPAMTCALLRAGADLFRPVSVLDHLIEMQDLYYQEPVYHCRIGKTSFMTYLHMPPAEA